MADLNAGNAPASRFKRDCSREARGSHRPGLANDFMAIVMVWQAQRLAEKHRGNALTGDRKPGLAR
jgi:uncharacterized protein YukJ